MSNSTLRDIREKAKRGRINTHRVMNGLARESYIDENNEVEFLLQMESLKRHGYHSMHVRFNSEGPPHDIKKKSIFGFFYVFE